MLGRLVTGVAALALFAISSIDAASNHVRIHVHTHGAANATSDDAPALASASFGAPHAKAGTICGANGLMGIKCANTATQAKAKAVMRVVFYRPSGERDYCTGWLWGNKGHIITAGQCISEQTGANDVAFEFGVELDKCTDTCKFNQCPVAEAISGWGSVRVVRDFGPWAVLKIVKGGEQFPKRYGYLQISNKPPKKDDVIALIQHPKGGPKQFARTADMDGKRMPGVTDVTPDPKYKFATVKYDGDAINDGSVGAPVLSFYEDLLVIGLHYKSDCENVGVSSSEMVEKLSKIKAVEGNDGFKTYVKPKSPWET